MARISMWLRSASNIPRNEGDSDEDDECDEGDTPPVVRPTSDENIPNATSTAMVANPSTCAELVSVATPLDLTDH